MTVYFIVNSAHFNEKRILTVDTAAVETEDFPLDLSHVSTSPSSSEGTMGFDHIYVINLPHRTDRRDRMQAIADYLKLKFTFVNGVYINETIVEEYVQFYGETTTPPQVACWRSHMNVYQLMLDNNDASALILEDDIDTETDLERRIREMRPYLPTDWDAWFLGHCHGKEWKGKIIGHPNLHQAVQPQCTHSYAVSRKGARKMLNVLSDIDRAIDKTIRDKYRAKLLKIYSVEPPITGQLRMKGNPSDVNPGALALKGSGQAILDDPVYPHLLSEGLYTPEE